jgi:hypothetical protein
MKSLIRTMIVLATCLTMFQSYSQIAALHVNELFATIESEDGEIILQWFTTKEVNTTCFIVERSYNGITYEVLGTQKAAGSSSFTRNYEISDRADTTLKVFYRVVLVTMDGRRMVSNIAVFKPTIIKMHDPNSDSMEIEAVISK